VAFYILSALLNPTESDSLCVDAAQEDVKAAAEKRLLEKKAKSSGPAS